MRTTIKLPRISDTVDLVVVTEVFVSIGDNVDQNTSLLAVDADKATVEVPSPITGTITEILVAPNDEVTTGTPLFVVETSS